MFHGRRTSSKNNHKPARQRSCRLAEPPNGLFGFKHRLKPCQVTAASHTHEILRAKINLETSRIAWKELLRFFASGTVIAVSPELDLIEVATRISADDKAPVEQWLSSGKVARVSDDQARIWLESDTMLWSVVVKPWILVQQQTN